MFVGGYYFMMRFGRVSLVTLAIGMAGGTAIGQSSTETYTYDALGRLILADTTGGQNEGETQSVCYDAADNRTRYRLGANHSVHACVDQGTAIGTPTPSPTPTPTNSPPVAVNDSATVTCGNSATVSLIANDSDPDGDTSLSVIALVKQSGAAMGASIVSPGSAMLSPTTSGTRVYSYTLSDSLGATDIGTLTVTVPSTGCAL